MPISQILNFFTKSERKQFFYLIFIQLLVSIIDVISILSVFPYLTLIINPEKIVSDPSLIFFYDLYELFFSADEIGFLIFLGALCVTFILVSSSSRALMQYYLNSFVEQNRTSISTRILKLHLDAPYSIYFDITTSDATKTIITDVNYFIDRVFRPIFLALSHLIFLVILTSMMIYINPILTFGAIILFLLFYTVIFRLFGIFFKDSGRSISIANQKMHKHIYDSLQMIKTIKAHNQEQFFQENYYKAAKATAISITKFVTVNQVTSYFVESLILGSVILASIFLVASAGDLNSPIIQKNIPILAVFSYVIIRMKPSIQSIYHGFSSLKWGEQFIHNLINSTKFDSDVNVAGKLQKISLSGSRIKFTENITFKDISFHFPKSSKFVLNAINLEVSKRDKVGIIGKSGSGKSTFLDLIIGLLEPTHGEILIDREDLAACNPKEWSSMIGYVPQDTILFKESLFANIAVNANPNKDNLKKVKELLRLLNLIELFPLLEDKGHSRLINEANISGGQRQRIGIARALFRNPQILILDEVTSSLDKKTAVNIFDLVYKLKNLTVFIVTHDLELLHSCNKIILFEDSRLSRELTYEDLVKLKFKI